VSKNTEVEIKSAASADTVEGYEKFINLCQREISKLIGSHAPSMEGGGVMMGEGPHKQTEGIRQDIRAFDGLLLGATLRTQLFAQMLKINGMPGRTPKPLWGAESYENAKILGAVLANLKTAGLEPTDDAIAVLQERLGFGVQRALLTATTNGLPLTAELALLAADHGLTRRSLLIDVANHQICCSGSAELARAFRGHLAPVRRIILESTGPEDLERRLKLFYADWTPQRLAPVLQNALVAHAANAIQAS